MSAIVDALKNDDYFDVRLTHLNSWLCWDDGYKEWVVRRKWGRRSVEILYRGTDEAMAVRFLIHGAERGEAK